MNRPDFSSRAFDVLRVLEVHDGDTFRFLLDTGFEEAAFPWIRMRNFSCPELKDPNGEAARVASTQLLHDYLESLWVVTYKVPPDLAAKMAERYGDSKRSFARYVADVWLDDGKLLGEELVTMGLAKPGAFVG